MAKEKAPALEAKVKGHKVYTFNQDYPLANKKKGDQVSLAKVPLHLMQYFDETKKEVAGLNKKTHKGEIPTDKNTKDEILKFLHANGVDDTAGLNKEDLLTLVDPFYAED